MTLFFAGIGEKIIHRCLQWDMIRSFLRKTRSKIYPLIIKSLVLYKNVKNYQKLPIKFG